jgi:hypothetical protein
MGNVTHPNFKRKARGGGYAKAPRPMVLLITQAEKDEGAEIARRDGCTENNIALKAYRAYLKKRKLRKPVANPPAIPIK